MIAFIIGLIWAAFFAGIAVHQRVILREARFDNSAYQDNEVKSAETIGNLRAQVKAHETTLVMLMEEMGK